MAFVGIHRRIISFRQVNLAIPTEELEQYRAKLTKTDQLESKELQRVIEILERSYEVLRNEVEG